VTRGNWYVWSDHPIKLFDTRIIFSDTEKSNCPGTRKPGAYYGHLSSDISPTSTTIIRACCWRWVRTDAPRLDLGWTAFGSMRFLISVSGGAPATRIF